MLSIVLILTVTFGFFFLIISSTPILFADEFVHSSVKYTRADFDNPQNLKEQLANDVPYNEVICYGEYDYLIYRTSDGSPVCVDSRHVGKLVGRGWATLGNSSLSISTDKTEYVVGEPITIVMKNDGDTKLFYNCSPHFTILDESDTIITPYDAASTLSCHRIAYFYPTSQIVLVWTQYDYFGKQVDPGIYRTTTIYSPPFVEQNLLLSDRSLINATFTIIPQ